MRPSLLRIAFLALAPAILVAAAPYKVRQGDTAAGIAKAHGLTVAQLQSYNPGLRMARLSIGQTVQVARTAPRPAVKAAKAPMAPVRAAAVETEVVHREALKVPPPSLPHTPGLGPSVLVHLERVLPVATRPIPPEVAPAAALMDLRGQDGARLASQMQPVVPEAEASPAARGLAFEPADPERLDLLWPVETRTISSSWGPRMRTRTVKVKQGSKKAKRIRYRGSHKGIDLTAPTGTDVYSVLDGEVVAVGRHRQYGNYVVVDHGNGVSTLYAHNKANFVEEGAIVRRGQKIGEVGRTGNATGPHLHFELRLRGERANPLPFLNDLEEVSGELMAQNAAAVPSSRR